MVVRLLVELLIVLLAFRIVRQPLRGVPLFGPSMPYFALAGAHLDV